MSSERKARGLWFFFTLSVGLFLTAGIAWFYTLFWEGIVTFLTNPTVPLSDKLSFAEYVLPGTVSIIIVFAFVLWVLYRVNPKRFPFREILDGLLGLGKDGSLAPPTKIDSKTISHAGQKFGKENRDIELKKVELASEEYRSSYYMAITQYFAVLLVIIGGFITLSVSVSIIGVLIADLGFLLLLPTGIYVVKITRKTIEKYKGQRPRLDELMEDIENGRSVGTVSEALRRLQERE